MLFVWFSVWHDGDCIENSSTNYFPVSFSVENSPSLQLCSKSHSSLCSAPPSVQTFQKESSCFWVMPAWAWQLLSDEWFLQGKKVLDTNSMAYSKIGGIGFRIEIIDSGFNFYSLEP